MEWRKPNRCPDLLLRDWKEAGRALGESWRQSAPGPDPCHSLPAAFSEGGTSRDPCAKEACGLRLGHEGGVRESGPAAVWGPLGMGSGDSVASSPQGSPSHFSALPGPPPPSRPRQFTAELVAELGRRRCAPVFCDGTLVRRRARDFKEAVLSLRGPGTLECLVTAGWVERELLCGS